MLDDSDEFAGFYLETAAAGTYHMVCFARDNDGAVHRYVTQGGTVWT